MGQSAALVAGFDAALGATIVTLDADGQNDPNDIPMLLNRLNESQDAVAVVGGPIQTGRQPVETHSGPVSPISCVMS